MLRHGKPRRSDYRWWDREVEPRLGSRLAGGFPVPPLIVGRQAVATTEPHLRAALRSGVPVWDPDGLFGDQLEARS